MTNEREWLRDNLHAHALGALEASEHERAELLLELDPESRRAARELEAVVALLAHAEPALAPPAELRGVLLARVRGRARPTAAAQASTGAQASIGARASTGARASADALAPDRSSAHDRAHTTREAPRAGAPAPASATGSNADARARRASIVPLVRWAALLLAVLGLAVWGLKLRRELDAQPPRVPAELLARAERIIRLGGTGTPGAVARVFVEADGERAHLALSGLRPLPPERIYQLWFKRGSDKPQSGGAFRVDAAGSVIAAVRVPVPLAELSACAVTEEDAPGRSAPSGPHLLDLQAN